jgi:glycosyltransferase involved in cell wall biosynthesis
MVEKRLKVELDLPVYNEEKCLKKNVERIISFLRSSGFEYDWKIVIIENGSSDRTLELARQLRDSHRGAVSCMHVEKKGRGRALREAWMISKADVVSYMDIDLSTDLRSYPVLIDAIAKEKYDIVTGARRMRGSRTERSLKREVLSNSYLFLLRLLFGVSFRDAGCGFKAMNRRVIDKVLPFVLDHEFFFDSELLLKCDKWGYRIKMMPIVWTEDPTTTVNIFQTVKNYVLSMLRIRLEFSIDSIGPR